MLDGGHFAVLCGLAQGWKEGAREGGYRRKAEE